jgi:hypothetical protein
VRASKEYALFACGEVVYNEVARGDIVWMRSFKLRAAGFFTRSSLNFKNGLLLMLQRVCAVTKSMGCL